MKNLSLPKLKFIELSMYCMDLLMVSDGDIEHVKEPKIRAIWHLFFVSALFYALFSLFAFPIIHGQFPDSTLAATLWRLYLAVIISYLLCLLFILTFRYYKYLLLTSKDLNFKNILFFYTTGILLFAYLYQAIYLIKPSSFNIPSPVIIPKQVLTEGGLVSFYSLVDFFVYSSTVIVSLSYPRISSASLIISIINVIEVLYGIIIISMLVATFVQMAGQIKK